MSARGPVVRVEGGRKLRGALKAAEGALLDDLQALHARIGSTVTPVAAANAPRRSGALAGTIRSSGTKAGAVIRAGYAAVPYAGPIHWGWPKRHIEPQPFLSEAAQATEPQWLADYLSEVQGILDDAAGDADGTGD
jgi:hypothetical protein